MTSLDALTHDAGARVRKGRTRELGGGLVHHLFRLLKLAQMHSLENQAFKTQLDEVASAFHDYRLKAGEPVAIFFARGVVFFAGEPLKASRSVYEAALELGAMMKKCGGSELSFAPDVSAEDLRVFVIATTRTLREPMTKFSDFDVPKVRLREVSAAAQLRGLEVEQLEEEQRIVRTYASAVVVMRRFFEDLLRGEAEMPRRIKRIAQALVDLSAGRTPAFLGVTAVRNANHDDAGRAVNTAILAVAMARRLSEERATLTRVAMSALLLDAGKPRALRALRGEDDSPAVVPTSLPDSAERSLPAGTVAVLASLGRINEPTIVRSVVAYEALWGRRTALLGGLYRGLRPASLHARIVSIARAYNDLLTPQPAEPSRSPAEALLRLEEELGASKDRADQTVLRLLMATVGLLPPGTLVQLSSGASAVVVHNDANRMRLRVLLEPDGALPEEPRELVAGEDGADIARIVGSDPSFAQRPSMPPPSLRNAPASASAMRATAPPPSIRNATAPPSARESAPVSARTVSPPPSLRNQPVPSGASSIPPSSPTLNSPASSRSAGATHPPAELGDDDKTVAMSRPMFPVRPSAPPAASSVVSAFPEPPATSAKTPSFSGDLQRSPLPHLLLNVLARSLTGSLLVTTPTKEEHTIIFEAGAPSKIASSSSARRLGEILVALGEAQQQQIDTAARKARERSLPIGKQLVIDGVVPSRTIMDALALQMRERIANLSELPKTSLYGFFQNQDWLPDQVALSTEPLSVIFSAMKVWSDHARMEDTLARLGTRPLMIHPHAVLERFGFSSEERALVEWIFEQRLSYPDAKIACADAVETVRLLIYALAIGRHIDLGPGQWPLGVPKITEESAVASISSVSSVSVSTPPPGSLTPPPTSVAPSASSGTFVPPSVSKVVAASSVNAPPSSQRRAAASGPSSSPTSRPTEPSISEMPPSQEPAFLRTATPEPGSEDRLSVPPSIRDTWSERRQQILDRAEQVAGKDHYEVLGVVRDAPSAEIQKAFLASVKLFHPDRLPEPLADVRDVASRVFSAIVEAHKTLSDPSARSAYDASLAAGPPVDDAEEQAEIERVLKASTCFQKAEILMRRNDIDAAEALARESVELDRQPDHVALLGWLHALKNQLPEALQFLNEAIDASPQSESALFYRGTVLKRMNHTAKAASDFRRVAELNPKNLDAAREVRLFEMRRQGPAEEAKPGLFGKLFSKKK